LPDICAEIIFRTKESTCLVPRYFSVVDKRCAGFRTRTISAKTHHQAYSKGWFVISTYSKGWFVMEWLLHNHVVLEDGKFTVSDGDGKFVSK